MPDYGAKYADKKLQDIDRSLKETYRLAQKELKQKLRDFNERFAERDKKKRKLLSEGKITKQEYKDWLTGQVFIRNQWQSSIRDVSEVLLQHNRQAVNLINNGRLDVFAENYNFMAFKGEGSTGISFGVYSTESVARLIAEEPQILPEWKIDEPKDYEWNYKKVNNIVQQGIIQGEGVNEITERLCRDLSTQNENRMRLFARTAYTGAQNAGRQQQMNDAADMGLEVHKQWLATLDNRTRDTHRVLDGEEVPYNEDFSNELEYPGDPAGDPEEVYNCRCTMVTIYPKYEDRSKPDWREEEEIDGRSYAEWKEAARARIEEKAARKQGEKEEAAKSGKSQSDKRQEEYNNTERVGQRAKIEGDEEKLKAIMQIPGITQDEAELIARALFGYGADEDDSWCSGRDSAIRSKATEEDAIYARALQKLVDLSPKYEGTAYRGISVTPDILDQMQIGTQFDERKYALSSWSSREDVARRYASRSAEERSGERVVFEVANPKHGAPIAHLALYNTEQEILVNNTNVRYSIVDRRQVEKNGRKFTWILIEEVEG